ncbi:MAG: AAA family ATPase, partial [Anaerolineae bacterium]|nr:AAA family ATPase [Anaerolineae bacterium]
MKREFVVLTAGVPSPLDSQSGYRFHPRDPAFITATRDVDEPKDVLLEQAAAWKLGTWLEPWYTCTGVKLMTLLITKLYMPPVSHRLVRRPRLIGELDDGLRSAHRLTLVSAPAGFGKTTLLSDWLHQVDRAAAWLSLDEGDNDPARFLTYVVAALQKVNPSLGQTARVMLQSAQGPPMESLLTNLVNDIAATPEPFVLVLDDYHAIESQAIHDALSFFLDHLPPPNQGVHLVLATRADPPLPVARLRARGQLTELHA